ncbi:MAG: hypothetical protein KKF85_14820 [Gammaproteobacteria bacterium]|nr:hypothetical protein [Rhodocyclaceae bacterium]MBU3909718.1 hypothetical protein [Gammaproteobacteria bacterium]MBU3989270.1 hypothetical protein [Gammaproteobacteria bacterium]MBU4005251.1 hypothetical protein [Gammaproteobacteria bacterium]MBU4022430.1 hypothetical protein [Gammaproteobacteria bacterium]
MISIKECLDYSDLTEDEVTIIAGLEHVPFATAAELACCLAQSEDGVEVLRELLKNAINDAKSGGHTTALRAARRAYRQFVANHPEQ